MLFNSYEFIFVFLPVVLTLFWAIGRSSVVLALTWIILCSLGFYAWWRPLDVLFIAPFIAINFGLAKLLQRLVMGDGRAGTARGVLAVGIVFNVGLLVYFKYANVAVETLNGYAGSHVSMARVIMPLAISFVSFQNMAFLIDVHARRVDSVKFREFCLFVLFFPQLIAGPIVHFREMMPQFRRITCRFDKISVSLGATLFTLGLFKKVVLADGLARFVSPIYENVAAGGEAHLIESWIAALGFTLQIYFDFSGYSDMASGLARCIGLRLPINFDSPLKASNIIDFWLRWHATLTRFLTDYLYNPLALKLTRRRMRKGLRGYTTRNVTAGSYFQVMAAPIVLTMLVSGLWHGVGLTFVLWGLVHGVFISINHAWRLIAPKLWPNKESYERFMTPAGFFITFVSVTAAMVLFRASTLQTAREILRGMAGLNGIGMPQQISQLLTGLPGSIKMLSQVGSEREFVLAVGWVGVSLLVALTLPNTFEFTAGYDPVLGASALRTRQRWLGRFLTWHPSIPWAVAVSALAAISVMRIGGESEFLYWHF